MINILYKRITSNIDESNIPVNELNKISKYGSMKKRIESLNGLYLLGESLRMYGINSYELSYTDKGKPYIDNSNFYFNISHCNEFAVCAISDNEIGIDIEMIKDKIKKLQPKITDDSKADSDNLTQLWTLKESFVKYLGIGIIMDLKKIKVKKIDEYFEIVYSNNIAYAKILKMENYYISICQKHIIDENLIIKKYN